MNDIIVKNDEYEELIKELSSRIILKNNFDISDVKLVSGVDLAYYEISGKNYAVCSICTVDYKSKELIEEVHCYDEVNFPYIPGYLAFRELPLILKTFKLLKKDPNIVMFDGNGYLHFRNMGIATHASFYINKPTIGIAKNYLKIENVDYMMPEDKAFAFTDIIIKDVVYGRCLRTHSHVKPIFISCGNYIDLDTVVTIVSNLINKESRLPIPVRLADLETKKLRRDILACFEQR